MHACQRCSCSCRLWALERCKGCGASARHAFEGAHDAMHYMRPQQSTGATRTQLAMQRIDGLSSPSTRAQNAAASNGAWPCARANLEQHLLEAHGVVELLLA